MLFGRGLGLPHPHPSHFSKVCLYLLASHHLAAEKNLGNRLHYQVELTFEQGEDRTTKTLDTFLVSAAPRCSLCSRRTLSFPECGPAETQLSFQ